MSALARRITLAAMFLLCAASAAAACSLAPPPGTAAGAARSEGEWLAAWDATLAASEKALGLDGGYRFLYGPAASVCGSSVAFVSQNPGALRPKEAVRAVTEERFNALGAEPAGRSAIRAQYARFAAAIGVPPDEILTGVALPFRASEKAEQARARGPEAVALGKAFWQPILANADITLIVAVSSRAADLVVEATGARLEEEFPAGWGKAKIRRYRTADGRLVVALPQLSRYRLFGHPGSEEALRRAFAR
jgi:hypothetical protein